MTLDKHLERLKHFDKYGMEQPAECPRCKSTRWILKMSGFICAQCRYFPGSTKWIELMREAAKRRGLHV